MEQLFEDTLKFVRELLPFGATNTSEQMTQICNKLHSSFIAPRVKVMQLRRGEVLHNIKQIRESLTITGAPSIFTADEAKKLNAHVARSLLRLIHYDLYNQLSKTQGLQHLVDSIELHSLFGTGNCGIMSYAAIIYLLKNKLNTAPITLLEIYDPTNNNGHQVVALGDPSIPSQCVIFDIWAEKYFLFSDWKKEAALPYRNIPLSPENLFIRFQFDTEPVQLPQSTLKFSTAEKNEIRKLTHEITAYCTRSILVDDEKQVPDQVNDLKSKSLTILKSIQSLGITKYQPSSLRGADKGTSFGANMFFYNQIDIENRSAAQLRDDFSNMVYQAKEGMWAIAMERSYQYYKGPNDLTIATLNSIVFVFALTKMARDIEDSVLCLSVAGNLLGHPDCFNIKNQKNLMAKNHMNGFASARMQEVRNLVSATHQGIPKELLRAILVPYHLVDLVKSVFIDTCVIPVSAVNIKLLWNPIELEMFGHSAIHQSMSGPHYERGLETFRKIFPNATKIGVHTTRLPLLPIPAFTPTVSDDTLYNKSYWKRFSAKNVTTAQLNLLNGYKNDAFVFPDTNNDYFVLCRPSFVKWLNTILKDFNSLNKSADLIKHCFNRYQYKTAFGFFANRTKELDKMKKQIIQHAEHNEFKACAEVAANAEVFVQVTHKHQTIFRESSLTQFNRQARANISHSTTSYQSQIDTSRRSSLLAHKPR